MPIDPVTIALTALSFFFGRQRGPGPIRSANISEAGTFRFEFPRQDDPRLRELADQARLLEQRLTDHITKGAPLPDQYYSGRQTTPYLRAVYNQVRDDVIAAREDFLAGLSPPGFVPTPEPPAGQGPREGETPITDSIPPDFFPLEFRPQFGGVQQSPVGEEDYFVPRFVRQAHRSIPGGAFGFAQQTPAGQRQLVGGMRSAGARARPRRRPRRAVSARPVARNSARSRGRKPRPGTKAWMSYIRGLRRKK